jgi:RimJ/RimL family protein N-acetyltransferase
LTFKDCNFYKGVDLKSCKPLKDWDVIKTKSILMSDNKVPSDFISPSGDTFKWLWLPSCDDKRLLDMRNSEHVLGNMRNNLPITEEAHLTFLQKYDSLQRLDFVLQHHESGEYVGGINISLTYHGFEIGKYIGNEKFLGQRLAFPMSNLFIDFIKENVKEIEKIRAVTKLKNYKNINLNFKLGFKIIKLVEEDCWLMELQ